MLILLGCFILRDCLVCNNHATVHLCSFSLQNGLNALHLAAKEGHTDLVEELLERGAPVDSSTKVVIVMLSPL